MHPGHHPHPLADGFVGDGLHLDGHFPRLAQVLPCDAADGLRHGGGEQGDLAIFRGLLQDPLHVVDKAHAQHLVGLVQHQAAQAGQVQGTAPHVVHHPARGTYHHLHPALQLAELAAVIGTAIDGQHVEALHVTGVGLEGLGHLDGQLPGGRQHQHLGFLLGQVEVGQQRQGKGRGLAGAGLRLAEDVRPLQHVGDDARLYRGGGFIADVGEALLQGRGQVQFGETGYRFRGRHVVILEIEGWARRAAGDYTAIIAGCPVYLPSGEPAAQKEYLSPTSKDSPASGA